MAVNEEVKIGLVALALVFLTILAINFRDKSKTVEVIYFRRSSCAIVNSADDVIHGIKGNLGDRMELTTIDMDEEKNFTEYQKKLVEKYEVIGVPEIIINGKEYAKEFTKDEIEKEIW